MAVTIPPRPAIPNLNPDDPNFAQQQLEANRAQANYNLLVQMATNEQKEESESKSSIVKSKDDALQAIIRNIAG